VNDIASVEFEAHVPLFFDPYDRNRATGSFILIDAISNATVGAGMIQEDIADPQALEEHALLSPETAQNQVSGSERHRRHGHYPGTFLLENRPALASKLERALFEQGFEVLLIPGAESPSLIFETIRTTQRMGAISVYCGDALDVQTKERVAAEVNSRLFEFSPQTASDEQLFLRSLTLAESLWLSKPQGRQEGAN
jgi:hypothetical protein